MRFAWKFKAELICVVRIDNPYTSENKKKVGKENELRNISYRFLKGNIEISVGLWKVK